VAFATLQDNKIANFFCEASFTAEYDFYDFAVERYRVNHNYIYGLTTAGDVAIFEYKHTSSTSQGAEAGNKCFLLGRIKIPEEFLGGKQVGMTAMRGSLILLNHKGELMLIESSNESLL